MAAPGGLPDLREALEAAPANPAPGQLRHGGGGGGGGGRGKAAALVPWDGRTQKWDPIGFDPQPYVHEALTPIES